MQIQTITNTNKYKHKQLQIKTGEDQNRLRRASATMQFSQKKLFRSNGKLGLGMGGDISPVTITSACNRLPNEQVHPVPCLLLLGS